MLDDPQLDSGEDLAAKALEEADDKMLTAEVEASDDLADTLQYLQNIIERNALELSRLKEEMKQKRESLKTVFENDAQLVEVAEKAKEVGREVSQRKTAINSSPQATQLRAGIGELREQQAEIEETLSNHLLNYYTLTNSTSFDTSDGDQWEFNIKAKVKARKK